MGDLDALDIAIQETSIANNTPITIFCDSQKALQAIQHPPSHKENRFLREQIYHKAKKLQNIGHPVVCRWTPGHSGLEGNKRADLMAKIERKKVVNKLNVGVRLHTSRKIWLKHGLESLLNGMK